MVQDDFTPERLASEIRALASAPQKLVQWPRRHARRE
jgi:hypothetical protein